MSEQIFNTDQATEEQKHALAAYLMARNDVLDDLCQFVGDGLCNGHISMSPEALRRMYAILDRAVGAHETVSEALGGGTVRFKTKDAPATPEKN